MTAPVKKPKPIASDFMFRRGRPAAPPDMPGFTSLSSVIDDDPSFSKLEIVFGVLIVIAFAVLFLYITTFQQRTACQESVQSQACLDERFDTCMATEKYTRQECIDLVGSK